jgi:hypothetical protein
VSGVGRFTVDVDPDGLEIAAHSWQVVADEVGDRARSLTGLEGTVSSGDWSGRTREAVFTEIAGVSRELSRCEPLVGRAAAELRSLAGYVRGVVDGDLPALNRSWQDAAGNRDRALRALGNSPGSADAPGGTGSAGGTGGADARQSRERAAREECQESQRGLERRFEALVEDLRERFVRAARVIADATIVEVPSDVIGRFNALGLSGAVPAWCTLDGDTFPPDLGAAQALKDSLPLAWAHHATARATVLARDLAAGGSLDAQATGELRGLLEDLQVDPVCCTEFLTGLGASNLVGLTFALANTGADTRDEAAALQASLGEVLAAATTDVGDTGNVTRAWVDDLERACRDQRTFHITGTTVQARGYTALGVLLGHGTYSPAFLDTVGGDLLALERTGNARGQGGAGFWAPTVLDPATGLATDTTPPDLDLTGTTSTLAAGWDPVVGLMTAIGKDRATAQAFFLDDQTTPPGSHLTHLDRVDYLLTERDWTTTSTAPETWARNGWDTQDPTGLQALGHALVTATVPATGDTASLRILESLVRETGNAENLHDTRITDTNLINPHLRLPIARILGAHIAEIHESFGEAKTETADPPVLFEENVLRMLADLARDPDAADYLTRQESKLTAALYYGYIADGGIVNGAFTDQAKEDIDTTSKCSGRILGALQVGEALRRGEKMEVMKQDEEQDLKTMSNAKEFFQSLVNVGITAGTITYPVAGEAAKGITSALINSIQDSQPKDHTGRAAYDTITALDKGAATNEGLLDHAVFLNALPEINKNGIFTGPSGELIPVNQWEDSHSASWDRYRKTVSNLQGRSLQTRESFQYGIIATSLALDISLESVDGSSK